jgi:hypothetical protein
MLTKPPRRTAPPASADAAAVDPNELQRKTSRRGGRVIRLRWDESDLIAIDIWRRESTIARPRSQPDRILSRPEAIRRLVRFGLTIGWPACERWHNLDRQILSPLQKDIGKIAVKNRKLNSCNAIAHKLISTEDYKTPLRTMRRRVTVAIDWVIEGLLYEPPHRWQEKFGIEPPPEMTSVPEHLWRESFGLPACGVEALLLPPEMTKQALVEKALEYLRHILTLQEEARLALEARWMLAKN